jgi:hypothetical protein
MLGSRCKWLQQKWGVYVQHQVQETNGMLRPSKSLYHAAFIQSHTIKYGLWLAPDQLASSCPIGGDISNLHHFTAHHQGCRLLAGPAFMGG